ncbi:MAG TPA: hypothetical protein ENK25_06770 [Bacteroidetes bacterium]|nr:hypothetical protein [Bacteroidota bacterium]
MNKYQLYKFSLIAGIVLILLGAFYKTQHHTGASEFLLTGMLISLIYIIIGISGIIRDKNKSLFNKLVWLLGFILFPFTAIAGIIYYYKHIRKHLIKNPPEEE